MRHSARRPAIRPARKGARALFVALLSMALVSSGSASLATGAPPRDVEQLLQEAVESETTLEASDAAEASRAGVPDGAGPDAEAPAPDVEAPAPDAEAPAPAVSAPESAQAEGETADAAADVAPSAEEADASDVGVLNVPDAPPGPNQAKIIVTAGGDRTGTGPTSTSTTPLAGATFEFFETSGPDVLTGGTPTDASCTTDATGECGVFVDLELGDNYFYAVQTDGPTGWIIPEFWADGTPFRFSTRTPIASGGSAETRTVRLPRQLTNTAPSPVWASVRPNPTPPPQCGLDMAMVIDLSNSVTHNEDEDLLSEYKASAATFVDALAGTPSRIALHTFATDAPAVGAANGGMSLTSVATEAGASELTTRINGFTATGGDPNNRAGGTNWDRGFHQVVESGEVYDVVLFLTDGAPTFHRNGYGDGGTTNIREVNEAILSANAVKATGAQVVLVGIGPDAFLPGAAIRIPLVSGPTEGVDYYRTQFDQLAQTLQEIATANCEGTLTVVKELVDTAGTVTPGGAGWTFTTPTSGVTPGAATTDETGAVNFAVTYPGGVFTRPVTVTETVNAGYELAPVGGANAVCTDTATGAAVSVTNAGATGFDVNVPATAVISCVVRNVELPPDYDDLVVTKTAQARYDRDYEWTIEKLVQGPDRQDVPADVESATFTYDVTVTPSDPIETGHQVFGTITVTNPNDVPFTGLSVLDSAPASICSVPYGAWDRTIGANATITLPYTCDVPGGTATTSDVNTVRVTWPAAAFPGTTGSATGTAPFDFADAEVTETDASVVVTDDHFDLEDYSGGLQEGNVVNAGSGPVTFTYDLTWDSVPGECVTYDNTATIGDNIIARMAPGFGTLAVDASSTETVTVCAGLDLEVEKNVVHSFDRTYLWDIEKDVDETRVEVGPDGTATFNYTVTATPQEFTDSEWAMTGTITVTNPNEWLDITADVVDSVDVGGGAACTVAGGDDAVIGAGETVELGYTCTFTSEPSYVGTNTATVTWDGAVPTPNHSAVGTAEVAADEWSQNPINQTITVIDDMTDPANPVPIGTATWNAAGTPQVFTYPVDHEGEPGVCVERTNTAWIAGTDQDASTTVTVCEQAPPEMTKTAAASFDRTYHWDIDKSVDGTDVVVDEDGQATFTYTVNAVPDGFTDEGWELTGEIMVTNPNTFAPLTVTVTDAAGVLGAVGCTVEDAEDVVIPASGSATFDYECDFVGQPSYQGTNTATAAWTDADGVARTETGTAPVAFELDGETDFVVDVYDQLEDDAPALIGQATWNAAGTPIPFTYPHTHQGVGGECVEFTNTAWVVVSDGDNPTDDETVELCVPSALELDKTATSADQNADGSWTVTYDVVVTNGALFDGRYDLSDTLEYGAGITPTAASWVLEGTATSGTWDLGAGDTAVLATDALIEAGATHTYVVTVVAEVAAGVIGSEPGQCSGDEGTDGGGFLNAANLTAYEQDITERDCAEPVAPTVEKTAGSLVENGDGTWDVTYTLTVDNPSDAQDLTYDLSDELAFADGVVIESASVSRGGTTYEDWDGVDETEIVSGEALPAAATHTYTVSVTVSLAG
ncbi:hypothetical protein V2J56_10765, partial [Georgenia sp. MJ206]